MTRAWWYLVAAGTVLGALLGWLVSRKRPVADLPDLRTELGAIEARAEAQKLTVEIGVIQALASIEAKHKETLDALDAQKKAEADRLRADPGQLAAFLVRAGRPRRM